MFGLALFAQAVADPALADFAQARADLPMPAEWLQWMYVWGEPAVTLGRSWGGLVTWSKVVGLYCLLAWVVGWLISAGRSSTPGAKSSPIKLGLVVAVLASGVLATLLGVLDDSGRLKLERIAGMKPGVWLAFLAVITLAALIEGQLWGAVRKLVSRADLFCLVAIHVAFALGYLVAYRWVASEQGRVVFLRSRGVVIPEGLVADWKMLGARIGVTYMGLVVLVRVFGMMASELVALRFRRLYAIAWQTVAEANRVSRAPWVVTAVFVVILAFTHWFLRSGERDAEISRVFVGTLTLLCSMLLSFMIIFTTPQSMPRDISNQTIYTIVSKPVRRLELIWGRLFGYMALVTFLIVLFGAISLIYLDRTVRYKIDVARAEARKYEATRPDHAKLKDAEADQLEGRLSARMPLFGALTFLDSKNKGHDRGIDVGQEQETRSFVEGATESRALWQFNVLRDPLSPGGIRDTTLPIESLLRPGSIEAIEDRLLNLRDEQIQAEQEKSKPGTKASDIVRLSAEAAAKSEELTRLGSELDGLKTKEKVVLTKIAALPPSQRRAARSELDEFHSPAIPIEMAFTIYRTTKGVVGDPVLASIKVSNPRPGMVPFPAVIPIHEYYTNKAAIPSRVLVGSRGVLTVEVRCVTANQYLGMAEGDFYILAGRGGFRMNYIKGLFGIWIQLMVLTAIGLFAGTFLSWPVAILTTLFFFVAGEAAFSYIAGFAVLTPDNIVIGPFESAIRIIDHQNMQNVLAATPSVLAAKTADAIVMPVMSRLVFLIPNFGALDVTNTVAEGFAVTWTQIRDLLLIGLGYTLPFTIAAYFVLKNREVAA